MTRVQFITQETAVPIEAPAAGRGHIQSLAYFDKPTDPLHLRLDRLDAGAVLALRSPSADTLIYVWSGAVTVRDVRLVERSSLILERGGAAEIRAVDGGAALLLFSEREPRRSARPGPRIRLLPRARVPCNANLGGQGLAGGALHADASDSSSHLWLHENDFHVGGTPVAVHSHSEDEIIFIREGELRTGNRRLGPGAALGIAANTKYGFEVGPAGLSFVNFRASAPTYQSADGAHSMDEAAFWTSETGRPAYIDLPIGIE